MSRWYEQFEKAVKAAGLEPKNCGNGHWQIRGGPLLVNFYPETGTVYVGGTRRGEKRCSIEDAIAAAKEPPRFEPGSAPKRKSPEKMKKIRRRMWGQDPRCHWCGKRTEFAESTLDHVIPRARGGLDNENNLVLSCEECNLKRGHEMPELKQHSLSGGSPMSDKSLKIIELRASNVKRLKAITIRPDGNVVIIGGANGAGKSSTLDAIMYGLGGKGVVCPKPVRDGEEEATITLDLGEYVVTRTLTADGRNTLSVRGKEGGKFSSPQTILDSLVGRLTFDPLEFSRQEPKKQVETLKALVGLDFVPMDQKKAAKAEDRVLVGREVKQLQGQLAGMRRHEDAPSVEVNAAALMEELNKARATNRSNEAMVMEIAAAASVVDKQTTLVELLKREMEEAEASLLVATTHLETLKAKPIPENVNDTAIVERIAGMDLINTKVRENKQRADVATKLAEREKKYEQLSVEIAAIDTEKQQKLAAAKFPVEGLSFDETGVLVRGVPFQQASAAEQLRVSVGMGISLNPKLKVLLVRDASLLDAKSLELVAQMADEHGAQLWLERVGNEDEGAVIIEDGMVAQREGSGAAAEAVGAAG